MCRHRDRADQQDRQSQYAHNNTLRDWWVGVSSLLNRILKDKALRGVFIDPSIGSLLAGEHLNIIKRRQGGRRC